MAKVIEIDLSDLCYVGSAVVGKPAYCLLKAILEYYHIEEEAKVIVNFGTEGMKVVKNETAMQLDGKTLEDIDRLQAYFDASIRLYDGYETAIALLLLS